MKKVVCTVIAVVMIAAMVLSLSGCGETGKYAGYWVSSGDSMCSILHLKSDGTFETVWWHSSSSGGVREYFEEKGISYPMSLSDVKTALETATALRGGDYDGTWNIKDNTINVVDSKSNVAQQYDMIDDDHIRDNFSQYYRAE